MMLDPWPAMRLPLSVYTSPAASLDSYSLCVAGQFQFNVGGVPGFSYIVQASTNLIEWVPFATEHFTIQLHGQRGALSQSDFTVRSTRHNRKVAAMPP